MYTCKYVVKDPRFAHPHPQIAPGLYRHKDVRTFKVELSTAEQEIYESVHVNQDVAKLCRRIEMSWDVLYRTDEDFGIEVYSLFCPEKGRLDLNEKISFYYGDRRYHAEVMQDAILLLAEATETIPERDSQRVPVVPTEEQRHMDGDSEIVGIETVEEQRQTIAGEQNGGINTLASITNQRALLWISSLACLYHDDSRWTKIFAIFGRFVIAALMLLYVAYIVWNPKLHHFWSINGNSWGDMYHVVEGAYFFFMYLVGIRLFSLRHMQDVIGKLPQTVVDDRWPEINWFVTKCAVCGFLVIFLPAAVLIPDLVYPKCHQGFDSEDKHLVNMTASVEYTSYFIFSFVNLPVFLYILMLVKNYITSIDSYKTWLLNIATDVDTAYEKFRKIQRLIRDSSNVLHWVLSLMFLLQLVFISMSLWHAVYRWELQFGNGTSTGCALPPEAFRSTLITLTHLLCVYIFPLYYISKIPQQVRLLLEDIHLFECREEVLIRDERVKAQVIGVVQSGLKIIPRFTVFRRIPISKLSTAIILVLVAPVLTIVWATVFKR